MIDPAFARALPYLDAQYFGQNGHEAAEIKNLGSITVGSNVFVDVGASLGQYAKRAGELLNNADIYCVEADPHKASRLREVVPQWQSESDNRFHVLEYAASDASGEIRFFIPEDHMSSGALFPLEDGSWLEVVAQCERLDVLLRETQVDFLKIDVEGAEYRTLVGARGLIEANPEIKILIEIAPWGDKETGARPSKVIKLMTQYRLGFTIYNNHYLFTRANGLVVWRLKNLALQLALDSPLIKRFAKWLVRLGRRQSV